MFANLSQLALATWGASLLLAMGNPEIGEYLPDVACGFAGMFGGAIMQLLTFDERQPTRKLILGEILASFVMGLFAYVIHMMGGATEFRYAFLGAIALGATGSVGFRQIVKRLAPHWLDKDQKK